LPPTIPEITKRPPLGHAENAFGCSQSHVIGNSPNSMIPIIVNLGRIVIDEGYY
jgi:hypothetical protein